MAKIVTMDDPAAVIAELYRVFSPYRVGDEISGCSDCILAEDSHLLVTTQRASLTVQDLNKYAFKALTTWGNLTDFKYFHPRLLELVLMEGTDTFNFPEVLFGKLDYARWFEWSPAEQRAVNKFLHVFWRAQLTREITEPYDDSIDTALCAIANACRNVDEYLNMWLASTERKAARQLAQFIWLHADRILTKNHPLVGHWESRPAAVDVLVWLKSDSVMRFLQRDTTIYTEHLQYVPNQLEAIRSAAPF